MFLYTFIILPFVCITSIDLYNMGITGDPEVVHIIIKLEPDRTRTWFPDPQLLFDLYTIFLCCTIVLTLAIFGSSFFYVILGLERGFGEDRQDFGWEGKAVRSSFESEKGIVTEVIEVVEVEMMEEKGEFMV